MPLTVKVDGLEISGFKGHYKNNMLTLFKGEGIEPAMDSEYKIEFRLSDNYRNTTIQFPNENSSTPPLALNIHDPERNINTVWLKQTKFKITFGEEIDYKIPIIIEGSAEDPTDIEFKGSFTAYTAAIESNNGVIDRSVSSFDTIDWIVRDWIKKNKSTKKIADYPDTCRYGGAYASCSYLYNDKNDELQIAKLLLVKENNVWEIKKSITKDEIFLANAIEPIFRDYPPFIFSPIAAKTFQDTIYKKLGGYRLISEPSTIPCGGGQAKGQPGWCEISYVKFEKERTLDTYAEGSCNYVTYLFEKNKNGSWDIVKTLDSDQKYNSHEQKVVKREENNSLVCF